MLPISRAAWKSDKVGNLWEMPWVHGSHGVGQQLILEAPVAQP